MVRTRQGSFLEEDLSSKYMGLGSCSRTRSGNMLHVCDDDADSDESCFVPRNKRRRLDGMSSRKSLRISARQRQSHTNGLGSSYLTRKTMRAIKEEEEGVTNNEDSIFDDGHESDEDDDDEPTIDDNEATNSAVRRSTRPKKFIYETLNQSWMLGMRGRDYSNVDEMQTDVKCNEEVEEENQDNLQYEDMYSRVKSQQRKQLDKSKNSSTIEPTEESETDDDGTSIVMGRERCRAGGSRWDSSKSSSEDMPHTKYDLRQKKPAINRFQVPQESSRPKKVSNNVFHITPPHRRSKFHMFKSPAHKSPIGQRRHATHNSSGSSSSTSDSGEDERRFERRKAKSMARARNRCLPTNFNAIEHALTDRLKAGGRMADIDPMNIDRSVTFESIGGLSAHVERLKEMILFPMLYPEVFERFKITPPRGVLFYGPPGTGKTLVARALANECSLGGDRTVAFFMRKGADCLSKWVGESERQLRLLFDQAFVMRPSIIFFDEIDGLAPVRSSRQDQIHSSIVSTLLALMDGLDSRGEVVVIGATNRIDSIDPALRRPGRFDREFHFPLPSLEDRETILKIHTKDWTPKLSNDFINQIALKTAGYCGADLKALCAEVALSALKRRYPQIYSSRQRLQLDYSSIRIEAKDFFKAIDNLVPAGQRTQISSGHPLTATVQPLMQKAHDEVFEILTNIFPHKTASSTANGKSGADSGEDYSDSEKMEIYETDEVDQLPNKKLPNCKMRFETTFSHRPRLLIVGKPDQGQTTHLAPAVLHALERFPVHRLDLPTLYAVSAKAPEESCAQVFSEAYRTRPSILYLPHLDQWWSTLSDTTRATFLTLLQDLDPCAPVLLLATADCLYEELPEQVASLFLAKHNEVYVMRNPTEEQRYDYFTDLITCHAALPPKLKRQHDTANEELPIAPPRETRELSHEELHRLEEQEEATLRELRLFLREILYKLARDRRFTSFTKPVDIAEVPDYLDIVKLPMDLETMLTKIDTHKYETVSQFLEDVDLICHNALEYNPDKNPSDKIIRHRACALRDAAHAIVDSELDPEFEKICQEIIEARRRRGCCPNKFAPVNYRTIPRNNPRLPAGNDDNDADMRDLSASASSIAECESSSDGKRFSRRVRGMEVDGGDNQSNDLKMTDENDSGSELIRVKKTKACIQSDDSGADETRSKKSQVKKNRPLHATGGKNEVIIRRKKSLWFGARRKVIKRSIDARTPKSKPSPSPSNEEAKDEVRAITPENEPASTSLRNRLFSDEEEDQLNSDLSKDSGTACTGPVNSPQSSEKNEVRDELKEGSSGFSSEEGTNIDEKDLCSRLSAGGKPKAKKAEGWMKSLHKIVDKSINPEPVSLVPEEPVRSVIVDRNRLQWLLDNIVEVTEDCSIDTLERFHCALRMCILKHGRQWDKTNLLKDLETQLEVFKHQQAS